MFTRTPLIMLCIKLHSIYPSYHNNLPLCRRFTRKYGTAVLLILYVSQGGVWQVLSQVLSSPCVQTDPDGTVEQGSAAYRVML